MEEERKIPNHLAIIMDGNGRWAKAKGLPRTAGHAQGAKVVEDMCEIVYNKGIKYFTVYAFSTENWTRPAQEVSIIMGLIRSHILRCIDKADKNNSRVRIIGDKSKLDPDIIDLIDKLEEKTKNNTGLQFQIALNYGARDEIKRAVCDISDKVKAGELDPSDISEDTISKALDTGDMPDPDLLIRTCGEQRLSNFLLWQLAYSEFYFTPVAWPDFNEEELERAIDAFNGRERRYGGLKG